jgi:hypothetical protein
MRGLRQVAMEAAFGVDLVQKRDEVGWISGIAVEKDQRSDGVARRRPIDVLKRHLRRSPSSSAVCRLRLLSRRQVCPPGAGRHVLPDSSIALRATRLLDFRA